jgi:hypothetical protein
MTSWNQGTPRSSTRPPPQTALAVQEIRNLQRKIVSPSTVLQLRTIFERLGISSTTRNIASQRFDAAELSWLICGAHLDQKHDVAENSPHPWMQELWKVTNGPFRGGEERSEFRDQLKRQLWDTVSDI